jgi:DNA-binding GntR family transcriptional regulator
VPPPRRENSAVDTLVDALRHDIMTGTLKSGQRIDLDEWAQRMQASRTPVRLALERLETEGFVKLSGRRGATIIDVTVTHIEDVLATRLVLDSALGRAAARNLSAGDLEVLRSHLERIEALKLPEDHAQMVEPALGFHAHLYRAAGAAMMYRLEMQSVHHTNVFLSSMWFTNRRIAFVGREHFRQLYHACETRDPDRVERLIRDYRIDMAGVILQDRVRTDVLHILPGVLSPAELRRLQAIVDHGEDPGTPTHPATTKPTSTASSARATKPASNRDLRYKTRGAARS